ncbi:MAG: STAS domain-containing protein [Planctomycetota bacterium]|nr:STAS domain-containing protein [Planctomycetota bacterium]
MALFRDCVDAMVADRTEEVLIDFADCRYLSSMFIGHLVDGIMRAKERHKDVRVLVSPEIGRFFEMAHLDQLFEYEVAEDRRIGSGVNPPVVQGA